MRGELSVLKRLVNFNKKDWKHVWWLFKNMIKQFFIGDLHESKEAYLFLKIHLSYDSTRVDSHE